MYDDIYQWESMGRTKSKELCRSKRTGGRLGVPGRFTAGGGGAEGCAKQNHKPRSPSGRNRVITAEKRWAPLQVRLSWQNRIGL